MILARINQSSLSVTGRANDAFGRVSIVQTIEFTVEDGLFYTISVEDNDTNDSPVSVIGNQSDVAVIDASGLDTENGVYIYSYFESTSTLIGTDGGDYFYRNGDADVRIRGGSGMDQIIAGGGDDLIWGGADNDGIDGGMGTDTLIMSGEFSEYSIDIVNGQYVISHIGGTGMDGTDIFVNIENLRFADQTIELNSILTDVRAEVSGVTLNISGSAADPSNMVNIEQIGDTIAVEDSNDPSTDVSVSGNQTTVRHIDASTLTGAGVRIFSSYDGRSTLTGSREDDYIYAFGSGDDILRGRSGDDDLIGNDGDDRLVGSFGDDMLDGGEGFDTALYFAARSEFLIEDTGDGFLVSHVGGTGGSGVDFLTDVEQIRFSDQTVFLDDLFFV